MHDEGLAGGGEHTQLPNGGQAAPQIDQVRSLLERSRGWSMTSRPAELFDLAGRDIAEIFSVDAGYFIYPPDSPTDSSFQVYAAWGGLGRHAAKLSERANQQASHAPSPLDYLSEAWLTVDQVPPAVRGDWQRWGIACGGSWPICIGEQRIGALVLRRTLVPAEDDGPLVALSAVQISLLLELQELRRQAEELSETDPLTGLLNRRGLFARLPILRAVAERSGRTLVLSIVDLDSLKDVNDAFGHPEGDRMLQELAEVLRRRVREGDLVARIGGDEFALLMLASPGGERRVQQRLDALLRDPARTWRASAGYAQWGRDGQDWETCYRTADTRLYGRRSARP